MAVENGRMAMDYLRSIAEAPLPLEVSEQHGMQCVHVLRAADLIEADIFYDDALVTYLRAVVYRITQQGRAALERDRGQLPLA